MSDSVSPEQISAAASLALAAARLASLGEARREARWLFQHVTGWSSAQMIADGDRPLEAEQQAAFLALVARRVQGEPLAYLLGSVDFMGRSFAVSPAALVPRPETEALVTLGVSHLQGFSRPRCLDLGTGSGVVGISLALECTEAAVVATDLSAPALSLAAANAQSLGARVAFAEGAWFEAPLPFSKFELIVSNPPYIAAGDPHLQGDGLPFEPQMALTDGQDGLSCIREIIAGAPAHLVSGGWLLFEHGYDQGEASRNLLQSAGFEAIFTHVDFAGHDRISGGRIMS